jgi:hypothetical protein
MRKIIGHHTCKNTGDGHLIEQNGVPVAKAEYNERNLKNPFLGTGYYFWDYNIEMARKWGKVHYNNKYYIFEAEINAEDTVLLDLVGNRQHQAEFKKLTADIAAYNKEKKDWPIGKVIEFLKELIAEDEANTIFFPFQSIRAEDYSVTDAKIYRFDKGSPNYTNLNPRLLICVIDVNPNTLTNFKLMESR